MLFVSQCCKRKREKKMKKKREYWIILSHIWRDEYFFSFIIFCCYFYLKRKRDFVSVSSQASADLNNDLGRTKPHKHTFILVYQMRPSLLVFSEEECLPFKMFIERTKKKRFKHKHTHDDYLNSFIYTHINEYSNF